MEKRKIVDSKWNFTIWAFLRDPTLAITEGVAIPLNNANNFYYLVAFWNHENDINLIWMNEI